MADKYFRVVKPEIRIIGVDDGVHIPRVKSLVLIVGVIFRGGYWLDGVISAQIRVDGFEATKAIAKMITNSAHYKQLRVIMLNGVTFGGFNIVDITELNELTKLPVIAVTRKKPDMNSIVKAIAHLSKPDKRLKAISSAGQIMPVKTRKKGKNIYLQIAGISNGDAQKIATLTSTRSNLPEPLRVAHLVASGVSFSNGKTRKKFKSINQGKSETVNGVTKSGVLS